VSPDVRTRLAQHNHDPPNRMTKLDVKLRGGRFAAVDQPKQPCLAADRFQFGLPDAAAGAASACATLPALGLRHDSSGSNSRFARRSEAAARRRAEGQTRSLSIPLTAGGWPSARWLKHLEPVGAHCVRDGTAEGWDRNRMEIARFAVCDRCHEIFLAALPSLRVVATTATPPKRSRWQAQVKDPHQARSRG
jgi:hypothetical protein